MSRKGAFCEYFVRTYILTKQNKLASIKILETHIIAQQIGQKVRRVYSNQIYGRQRNLSRLRGGFTGAVYEVFHIHTRENRWVLIMRYHEWSTVHSSFKSQT